MAMGIVKDSDFFKELPNVTKVNREEVSDSKTDVRGVIVDVTRGRPTGSVEVPNGLRELIGHEAVTNGRQSALDLANQFGISASSTSAYAKGATSTATYDERPNAPLIKNTKEKIASRAKSKLLNAIRNITEEKLEGAKAKELSAVARDMSAIIKDMEPDTIKTSEASGPTFIFYSPRTRKEESFDVIDVKE